MAEPKQTDAIEPAEGQANARPQVFMLLADPILEHIYRQRLKGKDFTVVWCNDRAQWKTALSSFNYDVLLLDLSLFPEDPSSVVRQAGALCPQADIIALSASDDARLAVAAFHAGVADYLIKPIHPEKIRWAIAKVLNQRSLKSSSSELNADLFVFEAAHHIHMSESPEQMRALAANHLVRIHGGSGALWAWPEAPGTAEDKLVYEAHADNEKAAQDAFAALRRQPGGETAALFHHRRTSTPDDWRTGNLVWIPLNTTWMGGVFVYDCKIPASAELTSRTEFLVRNLETSLDSYRRFTEAKQLSYIDDLTGLYNGRYLEVALTALVDGAKQGGGFCILFIDVDKFKHVNDQHGHLVGSHLLVQMARLLKKNVRSNDQLFRYGGDEFLVLLPTVPIERGLETAERLRQEVENRTFSGTNGNFQVTLSVGVARFPDHAQTAKDVLQMADDAMYSSKKTGRNKVFVATLPGKK